MTQQDKVLVAFVSNSYCVQDFKSSLPEGHHYERNEIVQYALGEVMQHYGKHLQRQAARHNAIGIGNTIRIEVREQGWDIDVRLHLEEQHETEDVVP